MTLFTSVLIDGTPQDPATASIPVHDVGFVRGYGAFEVVRAFDGRCFRLDGHLERLDRSTTKLGIETPGAAVIAEWARAVAEGLPEAIIRILVSAGDDPFEGPSRIIVTAEPAAPQPESITLMPVPAPWHSDGADWELLRAKTLSYANNFAATRVARLAGFDDALLVGRSGRLLEGPTFAVGWVVDEGENVYETPALSLGILDSITRQAALEAAAEAGLAFREVECDESRLASATEVFALSTVKDALPVTAVGDRRFPAGPATAALHTALLELMNGELGAGRPARTPR